VAFPDHLLQDDEALVLDLRPHWFYLAGPVGALAAAVALGVAALTTGNGVLQVAAGVLVVAALVYFAVRYVRYVFINFVVTTERIVYREGVFSRRNTQMPLEKINTVDFRQSLLERVLGAGDLIIESGSEAGVARFSDIRDPLDVQQEINRQMDAHEKGLFRGQAREATIPEQISQLAELRDRGIISVPEFEAKKAQLLERM
jgi:uncharacterized membrane protein YdbT with pleckstrin-like domain